jgi:hypothetical protein
MGVGRIEVLGNLGGKGLDLGWKWAARLIGVMRDSVVGAKTRLKWMYEGAHLPTFPLQVP